MNVAYLKKIAVLLNNHAFVGNREIQKLLAETNRYISDAEQCLKFQNRVLNIALNENERNLVQSVTLMLQSKLNPEQQSGQPIGKIQPIQMPYGGKNV